MTTTAVRPRVRRTALLQGTRILLGLFGAVKLAGTAFFLFFATAEQNGDPEGLADWSVGIWSTALAVAFLVAAARLGADRRVLPALAGVLLLDLVFSAVKLTVYDEPEAVLFMAVDLVIIVLLTLIGRRTRT
ncbi:hypothetical protein E4P39_19925 [Blastococcus sp. CT_GayMR19]|uniref:hypothetical protein n=1 Tax=Blastococcus sp. CT_GayMR19 TaxID=2559608 RepID=UPI0010737E9C|nr:hypothetical protein [Blastococcus sp. CT_GayMR19]TFV70554.1 hypothetical protein E4P39_19925 [Blastococcus sp. CT_GayMR19]